MEEPGFWDDAEKSTKLVQEAKHLKDTVELYRGLEQEYEDIQVMIEMGYEENDPSLIPEIEEMLQEFEKSLEKLRLETLLSGEYDKYNAILRLNAGAGGTESCDWCSMLYRMYCRWADKMGFKTEVLDYLDGDEAGIKSVTIQINGENAFGYLKSERGVQIFGKWNPFGVLGAGMFFGFSQTLGFYAKDIPFLATLPTEFFSMFPYVLTIIALVIFAGKSVGPKAAGEIYDTGKR